MAKVTLEDRAQMQVDWQRLEEAMQAVPSRSERPPDSFTVAEYAKRKGMMHNGAMLRLKRAVQAGVLECTEPVPGVPTYYWVKDG